MIYVVTNRNLVKEESFYEAIERCCKSSINGIILREKDLSHTELLLMAKEVKGITDRYNIPLIINGDEKIAKEINAYGCHFGYSVLPENYNKDKMKLGISIHSVKEAIEAERLGADYIIAGNIFETDCKPGLKGRGIDFIDNIKKNISIPIIAIGGIDIENVREVIDAGIDRVAIMSSAMKDKEYKFIRKLKDEMEGTI